MYEFVTVNPTSRPAVMYAHRTASGPRGPCPRMIVVSGPFTLRTSMSLVITTRFVSKCPGVTRPPSSYTPLVTHTTSPATTARSTAAWIVCLAVAQLAAFPESSGRPAST